MHCLVTFQADASPHTNHITHLDGLVAESGGVEERGVLDDPGIDRVDPDPLLGHVQARAPSRRV